MTALDELLRQIEDAITEHVDGWGNSRLGYITDQAGPSVLRAVLEAGWRPTDRELAVCATCRGAATVDVGESYRPWCRECAGTGYVEAAGVTA